MKKTVPSLTTEKELSVLGKLSELQLAGAGQQSTAKDTGDAYYGSRDQRLE